MKTTKKLLAILLTVFLLATMLPTVMADGETYSITITNAASGHTYEAYQVFKGTLSDGKLTDIDWGTGISSGDAIISALGGTETYADVDAVADYLKGLNNDSDALKAFAKIVASNLASSATASSSSGEVQSNGTYSYTITLSSAGYYFVKDKDNTVPSTDAYTSYILQVAGTESVAVKTSVPTVEKKVKDINDSTDSASSGWQDSADHDIGDSVSFQITGTVASNYADYSTYSYTFTDQPCTGLTINTANIKVYLNSEADANDITSNFTITPANTTIENGSQFTVSADLKKISGVDKDSKIIVRYEATLNSNADIGLPGNPNQAKLTFSNNPNGEGTGETAWDKVIVFTYQLVVSKVDENKNAKTGATFTLSKQDSSGNFKEVGKIVGTEKITFTWTGLDDGVYKLEETEAPAGYNKMDPLTFTVTASHDIEADNPTLSTLTATLGSTASVVEGVIATSTDTGIMSFTIQNKPGSTLPTTGGVGTTMFYVIGSVLVIGAFILLVAKKRANRTN